eukprot:TRINITY_DN3144_c0_g1_i2.p1 TRINITY_DN3144_c0_g1~~TRINITY_DN3144_c0_g1_i2.p1  ORF type:complete len:112 (-),score=13.78 TRINITY_DN3144_c0_g1_i2:51-386(-)
MGRVDIPLPSIIPNKYHEKWFTLSTIQDEPVVSGAIKIGFHLRTEKIVEQVEVFDETDLDQSEMQILKFLGGSFGATFVLFILSYFFGTFSLFCIVLITAAIAYYSMMNLS